MLVSVSPGRIGRRLAGGDGFGPEVADAFGEHRDDVIDLAFRDELGDHLEDGADDVLGLAMGDVGADVVEELFAVSLFEWLAGGMPALVVGAAEEEGELCAELGGLVGPMRSRRAWRVARSGW